MAGTEETAFVEERPKRTKERELEGMRTMEDERANVANRREKTMNGRNEQENPDERTMTEDENRDRRENEVGRAERTLFQTSREYRRKEQRKRYKERREQARNDQTRTEERPQTRDEQPVYQRFRAMPNEHFRTGFHITDALVKTLPGLKVRPNINREFIISSSNRRGSTGTCHHYPFGWESRNTRGPQLNSRSRLG